MELLIYWILFRCWILILILNLIFCSQNSDIEYMLQNKDQFFDTVNGSFKSRDEKVSWHV